MKKKAKKKTCRGNKALYRLDDRLGSGGYGQAWKATIITIYKSEEWLTKPSPTKGSSVMIKWANINKQYSADENRRFLQDVNSEINSELSALKRLANLKCVAHVYDHGLIDVKLSDRSHHAAIFLVEEFLDGIRFDEYILQNYGLVVNKKLIFTGIKDLNVFLEFALQLATAVQEMHHQSVVHGDIWQENIMVMKSDKLHFFDLGASVIRNTAFLRPDTLARQRSDNYSAPELRSGENRHGRRSDIYSLGGLFHFMATGKHPPTPIANNLELKNTIVANIESSNPSLLVSNCGIADIITRCLRYNKDERTRDADALINEIRLFSFSNSNSKNKRRSAKDCVACLLGKRHSIDGLFSRMLKMDAAQLKSRADDMRRGILEVSGNHEDLVLGMTTYLSVLNELDIFLARTTPRFWKSENMGINGRFLSMVKLVAQRGAKIKHLMLVCESDLTHPEYRKILETHLTAIKQVKSSLKGELNFFCKIVSESYRQSKIQEKQWECCYAISGNEIKALQSVYDRKDILHTVRFIRQESATLARVLKKMEEEISESIPLEKWLGRKAEDSNST